jgi:hypothetical protein
LTGGAQEAIATQNIQSGIDRFNQIAERTNYKCGFCINIGISEAAHKLGFRAGEEEQVKCLDDSYASECDRTTYYDGPNYCCATTATKSIVFPVGQYSFLRIMSINY